MPTLLITGANRGIGLELCKQYVQQGWRVFATCRSPEDAKELNQLVADNKDLLSVHALDVSNEYQMSELQKTLKNVPVDILLNNAGVYGYGATEFGKTQSDAWDEAVEINLLAPMKMMEHFVENVAISDKKIIASISSKMASMEDNTSGGSYAYRATKAALNAVMVSAAHDLKHLDITSLILHPGWVRTDMGGPNGEISVEESATLLRKNLTDCTIADSGCFLDIDGSIIPW
ncbi:SDR family oxidoreductase [Cocleimonas flava]|uniref:NAD(P)-dependent dehydrogenase (Short-subunit alcohol dehydrogenase family) n=1 Tax=Cocleimonas flava TaxID=634765 RepID=A0A4R1F3P2_9GAMM|nr:MULTISPECIES: SDR family oxidoreductase [Cocleimonas]MEB8432068.1 SDR family oxidoreductase [Cocleimonas sp. KMM 6892]MEC4714846.1 SDR family oxidoreductase [Cocleimonas sp. KMM 6895]MEC4744340.1 SDR family oxidoreductase [Cocleimonas sp. KMM 6896]TCJ87069.1 NAD(P)-dependent dehydrogenase (short-subunit alcohol dehydrogenase family) [Cocleimonas flava]